MHFIEDVFLSYLVPREWYMHNENLGHSSNAGAYRYTVLHWTATCRKVFSTQSYGKNFNFNSKSGEVYLRSMSLVARERDVIIARGAEDGPREFSLYYNVNGDSNHPQLIERRLSSPQAFESETLTLVIRPELIFRRRVVVVYFW